MIAIFKQVLIMNIYILKRQNAAWLHPAMFLLIMSTLFGISTIESDTLKSMAAQIVWIAFLMTSLMTIEGCLRKDIEEGLLEQLCQSEYPLWWLILAKACALWFVACLPAICLIPLLGIIMHLSFIESGLLLLSVLLGSPALTLIALFGTTLTLTLPNSGVLLGIILLPLYVPILLFGVQVLNVPIQSNQLLAQLSFLTAISILTISLLPHAIAFALKSAVEE